MLDFVPVNLSKFLGRGMSGLKPEKKNARLAMDEYLLSDPIGARRELTKAIKTEVPEFFEQLREGVYPAFARATKGWILKHDKLPTWILVQSHPSQLKAALLQWARKFNAEEDWILEEALKLLWHWHRYPKMREELDVGDFLLDSPATWGLVTEAERQFHFQDAGWNPQFQTWAEYNKRVSVRIKQELREYQQKIRDLAEHRRGVRVQSRYSTEDFRYFALYRFAGMSAAGIFKRLELNGDYSAVTKGMKAAAKILQMSHGRKPNSGRLES
jgi:hypothetical protein